MLHSHCVVFGMTGWLVCLAISKSSDEDAAKATSYATARRRNWHNGTIA